MQPPPAPDEWQEVGPAFLVAFPDIMAELLDPSASPTLPITRFQAATRAALRASKPLPPFLHALAQTNESLHEFLTQAFPVFAEAVFRKEARPADVPLVQRCLALVLRLLVLYLPLEIEPLSSLLLLLLGGGEGGREAGRISVGLAAYVPVQYRYLVPGGLYQVHGRPMMQK